ncbi:MAG: symmetrical bis(5'-nucleosyl)-tetraphosphatase [Pseudomonadota bacterium]
MAVYAIGDIQGCYDEFRQLLDKIAFDSDKDHLWLVGDLVNRGPDSLTVLRFVKQLGDRAVVVLGNHDLHLLALAYGNPRQAREASLREILSAPDREELIEWLRHQPLMYHDAERGFSLIHAGLPPQWDVPTALGCAREVETLLRGDDIREFLKEMYGNKPDRWKPGLRGMARWRFIVNCLTRLRYCTDKGRLSLKEKGPPGFHQTAGSLPWFDVPGRLSQENRIVFGHWSTLGLFQRNNVWCLDSGCLWGGRLTALRIRRQKPMTPVQIPCDAFLMPGDEE